MAKQDISVRSLVDKVLRGELTLPEMQRKYVWTGVKVRDLLDSLYRGYPSGSILVWETDPVENNRSLQIHGAEKTPFASNLLLLDGQQRLTSLTAILTGNPIQVRKKVRPIDILFNLEHPDNFWEETPLDIEEDFEDDDDDEDDDELDIQEELRKKTFVVGSRSLKNDPAWISVSDIFKKSDGQLLKPLGINSDDPRWDKYSERISQVRKIQDYSYVMQILDKAMSYEEVTEIFVRVNSLGVKLRGSDLALAQITSRWKGFIQELETFINLFQNNEDYLNESGIIVKSLVAFATGQSRYKTVGKVPLEKFQAAWEQTKKGIEYSINFLKANVRVDSLHLISSPFLLLPIAYYAMKNGGKVSPDNEKKLLLWFYVAQMKGRYSHGSSESILDSDLSSINKFNSLEELLKNLKLQVKDFYVSEEEIKGKSRRSPFFNMMFYISKQRGIKDWFTGIALSEKLTGRTHAIQFHHIFPKALLRKEGMNRKEINDISNLAFINGKTNREISSKEPIKYLSDLIKKSGEIVLNGYHIPVNTELLEVKKYEQFLDERRAEIVIEINDFIRKIDSVKMEILKSEKEKVID